MRTPFTWARPLATLAGLLAMAAVVHAQTLEAVETATTPDGGVVVRIRFNAAMRFLAQLPAGPSTHYTLRTELQNGDEAVMRQLIAETRQATSSPGAPAVSVTYEPDLRSRTRQVQVSFERSVQAQARQGTNSRTIELLLRPVDKALLRFGVLLESLPIDRRNEAKPIPPQLQGFDITSSVASYPDGQRFDVVVGYFATPEEADAVLVLARSRFAQARVFELGAAPAATVAQAASAPTAAVAGGAAVATATSASAAAGPAAPPAAAASASTPAPSSGIAAVADGAASPEVEREAEELLRTSRGFLTAGQLDQAIMSLGTLLRLPPNTRSQEAQELIGMAWDRAGSPSRALAEYDLYLRLYPNGEGAQRVADRTKVLARALPAVQPAAGTTTRTEPKLINGAVSLYYTGGRAKSQSLVNVANGIDQATLSRTAESAFVTSVDLNGRVPVREGDEGRFVVRGSASANLLSGKSSKTQLNAAYFDYKLSEKGIAVRAGRQSPIGGGLLGLFDGVSATATPMAGVRTSIMGGVPANTLVSAPGEKLFAAVVEADGLIERAGGSLYLLNQTSEGITNRRALGAEARYAADRWSVNGLLDYETEFRALNAWSLQGSWQPLDGTHLTLLADQRRAPSLQLTNALISSGAASLRTLLQVKTLEQIRTDAMATSAQARQLLVSMAQTFSKNWQVSTDLRYSAIGALPAVGDFQATAATGAQVTWSLQAVGSGLVQQRDIHNFNLSVVRTPKFNGMQASYTNLSMMGEEGRITIEPSFRLYTQTDDQDIRLTRVGPGLRMSYKMNQRSNLVSELLYEDSRSHGPTGNDHTRSAFFYVGYRVELF